MPFTQQFDINISNVKSIGRAWEIEIEVTLNSGDDRWPGPRIWRGVEDTGFLYDIQINYTYVIEED